MASGVESAMQEVQRSLGRIEGLQNQLLLRFDEHAKADQVAFNIINKAFETRDMAIAKLREDHDDKIAALQAEQDRAKGAGKVILAVLGTAATFVGGAVMAVLEHYFKVKV